MSPEAKGPSSLLLLLLLLLGGIDFGLSFSPAGEHLEHPHSPCNFDPRCYCSVGAAEYGSVVCDGVPLADVPEELQESRVFQLRLRNNGLYRFPDAKLSGSGMWGLEVSHNPVSEIPTMAFYGLERALWELNLSHNRLTRVPADSIALLKKLSVLILSDNQISELRRSDLRSLSSSLKSLDLAGNSLTSVPEGIFWDLQRLESLDLSRNNIIQIHSMAFQNGVPLLANLNLADNLMGKVPFISLGHVKSLRHLDLSKNRIEKIEDPFFFQQQQQQGQHRLRLDSLVLSENSISALGPKAFQNFEHINYTSLSSNPLRSIEADAFADTQVRHLDLSNCFLHSLKPRSFHGLEKSLESLDLGGNRLSELPAELLGDFESVKRLRLSDNLLLSLSPNASFGGFGHNLKELFLSGEDMRYVSLEELGLLRNLRTLSLSTVRKYGMQFDHLAPSLEELSLADSDLMSVERSAFRHVPGVSSLDLSNNKISRIDDDAFKEVGNALVRLKMSNALHFTQLPSDAFQSLTGMVTLDLSNNHVRKMPLDTFHKMTRLQHLYLQDNEISTFKRGTFHSQANPSLSVLDLSFNQVPSVESDTFRFPELRRLLLGDNQIVRVEPRSFVEMTKLITLSLEGNRITDLPDEAFQNLHHLQELNLAYNRLSSLNFNAFDSVGTLSHLTLDLSHNRLQVLKVNRSDAIPTNVMKLDLSYNNISQVEVTFFEPVRNELKILNMSRNILTEISPDDIGQLKRLFCLDLSHNWLSFIEPTTFMAARGLRSVRLDHNRLESLNPALFSSQGKLQYVDLSYNSLSFLPEQLFQRTDLEMFRAAHNRLNEIPVKALNPVQSTLKYLDLSGNQITTISDSQLNQIQLLVVLVLSHNDITSLDREAFCCVPNLEHLDLSHNPLHRVNPDTFAGVEAHLQHLSLANTSLTLLPSFQLPRLKSLNVSGNQLTFVPPNTLANLSEVRELDLSDNELPAPPSSAWHSMHHLRSLVVAGNPIARVNNDSFVGLQHLEQLDISGIPATTYQTGPFGANLPNLRRLRVQLVPELSELNLASLLSGNHALEHLHLHLAKELFKSGGGGGGGRAGGSGERAAAALKGAVLSHQLQDELPLRLRRITLEGEIIDNLHPAAFKYLRSRRLQLSFRASSRLNVDRDLFLNLGHVQNLSVEVTASKGGDVHNFSEHAGGEIRHLGNPVTSYSPNHPRAVFLQQLSIAGNRWTCNCEGIGWTEKWLRRWRGAFCGGAATDSSLSSSSDECRSVVRDLRSASCSSSNSRSKPGGVAATSVLEELRDRLECDVFNRADVTKSNYLISCTILLVLVAVKNQ